MPGGVSILRRAASFALAALITSSSAVSTHAQGVRLEKSSPAGFELTGGAGASAWRLRYGSTSAYQPHLHEVSAERAYLAHGPWLRLVDTTAGIVIGRWRFPGLITGLTREGVSDRLQVQFEISPLTGDPVRTASFDPRDGVVPSWESGSLLSFRASQSEAAGLVNPLESRGLSTTPLAATVAAARIPELDAIIHRDPLSPWLRIGLGKLLRDVGDPRAREAFADAARLAGGDFTDLFPIAAYLDRLDERDASAAAFDRAYANYLSRGNDPRMLSLLIARMVLYMPFDAQQSADRRRELIERVYLVAPGVEGADRAWEQHARWLASQGDADGARTWHARAVDAANTSLHIVNDRFLVALDRMALLAGGAVMAAVLMVLAWNLKYRPQRRLARAADPERVGVTRRGLLNLEYWSRRERLTFCLVVLVGWYAAGLAARYGQVIQRASAIPINAGMGSFAGPDAEWFFSQRLPDSPERELLRAIAHHQNRETDRAERLYRALPAFAESWNNLGVLLRESGQEDQAREAFERALQMNPALAEARLNLGRRAQGVAAERHHHYLPDRPMLAPPTRDHLLQAFAGGSPAQWYLWALAGPFGGPSPEAIRQFAGPQSPAMYLPVVMTGAALLALSLWLVIPIREVTRPPGRGFGVCEVALPGTSPHYGAVAGPVLLATGCLVLSAALQIAAGTPYLASAAMLPGVARAFGLNEIAPSTVAVNWLWIGGFTALLMAINLWVVLGGRRRARVLDAPR